MIFISLDYSPWSEKARWVLDLTGVRYKPVEYVSMIGVPWLRYKTKNWRGPVSVPVLITKDRVLSDSLEIARFADKNSSHCDHKSLFPCNESIHYWNDLSEQALSIGRYLCVQRQLEDKNAQLEVLPGLIPGGLKKHFTWLAKSGLDYHLKKYPEDSKDLESYRAILLELQQALEGKPYILDEFSYCDIAMALALQYLQPVQSRYSAPGPATAKCWSNPSLHEEFSDLIEWRDRIYEQHRP